MKFNVYRPVGNARWLDEQGKEVQGYKTIEKVGTVEAPNVTAAFAKARSYKDPSPILEQVA